MGVVVSVAERDDADARAEHHEMTVLVRDWLTKLPDKQRIVIMLWRTRRRDQPQQMA